jgi:hypothetical protein
MSSPVGQMMPPQMGGMKMTVLDEASIMIGHFILIGLILVSVYISRIPDSFKMLFRKPLYQLIGFVLIIALTIQYGWMHGIMAALAFALLVSNAIRKTEGMTNYVSMTMAPDVFVIEDADTTFVPTNHRWFVEKVLGETPFLIREKEVRTSAVQDFSEKSMGSSTVTR